MEEPAARLCSYYEINRKKNRKNDASLDIESQEEWEIGKTYTGEWSNDLRDGYGVQIWSNASKYEGDWKCNKRNGYGVYWIATKESADCKQKNAHITTDDDDDVMSVFNKTSSELSSYTSANVNHLLSLRDELYNNKLNKSRNRRESSETLHKQYEGEWKNDLKHGKGTFHYKNGDKFEGIFCESLRCGNGIMYYQNGDKYEGDWKFNKKNGFGIHTNRKEKNIYIGYWMNNKKEGPGYCKFINDNKLYVAEWVNGIAKCGYFVNINEVGIAMNAEKDVIPQLTELSLINPDSVLSQEIKNIRKERKIIRALTNVDDIHHLFEKENELKNKIIDIFDQIAMPTKNNTQQCCVNKENLYDSISDFELPPSFYRNEENHKQKLNLCIAKYCNDLGIQKSNTSNHNNTVFIVTLLDFAKIVYLLLGQ